MPNRTRYEKLLLIICLYSASVTANEYTLAIQACATTGANPGYLPTTRQLFARENQASIQNHYHQQLSQSLAGKILPAISGYSAVCNLIPTSTPTRILSHPIKVT